MGGNLLKEITRRHNLDEYLVKTGEILKRVCWSVSLLSIRNTSAITLIQAYHNKASFGDADFVYCTDDDQPYSIDDLIAEFNPTKIVKNGEVISFDYKELQIDMIHAKRECFDYAVSYFAYNDLGNFIGKLARYFGLSHGHKGLYLPIRENDGNLIDSVLVSADHDATLRFVGLDPNVFNHYGFDTMEDVYRYVQSSPYFNPDSYKLENISAIGRIRDKKRESYRNFLKFNESYDGPILEKVVDKSVFLERIFAYFPDVEERFDEVMKRYAFTKLVKTKFNGDVVKLLTGLENKELGTFMQVLKAKAVFKPCVIAYLSSEQIHNNIVEVFYGHTE